MIRFSIVVPTFGRPLLLRDCLQAISELEFNRDEFEVIVVDDGNEMPPQDIVAAFEKRMQVRMVSRPNGGPGAARNTGAQVARGEYLAFTDDDCAPDKNWLRALDAQLRLTPDAAVGGQVVNSLDGNACSAASQSLVSYLYDYYSKNNTSRRRFFTTGNLALKSLAFHEIGGFDLQSLADTAEDRELCARWCDSGRQLVYAPSAVVRHAHTLTVTTLWKQHFHYGRGAVYFHRARGKVERGRKLRLEPLVFYIDLLRYPFSTPAGELSRAVQVLLLGLTQIAYAAGYYTERAWPRLRISTPE